MNSKYTYIDGVHAWKLMFGTKYPYPCRAGAPVSKAERRMESLPDELLGKVG